VIGERAVIDVAERLSTTQHNLTGQSYRRRLSEGSPRNPFFQIRFWILQGSIGGSCYTVSSQKAGTPLFRSDLLPVNMRGKP
jgi:hypothetical protein